MTNEQNQIAEVLRFFELSAPTKTEVLTAGLVNQNIAVDTSKGRFVIKFLKRLRKENIENDIAIQEQLIKNNIGSIHYLHTSDGTYLFANKGIAAVVSPRIEGSIPRPYIPETAIAVGTALGQFHVTVKTLPHEYKAWLNPTMAQHPIEREHNPLTVNARSLIAEGIELFNTALPEGIIHSDLHEDNVLVRDSEPTKTVGILDFEEAERNIFIVDIARSLLSVCRDKTNNALDPLLIKKFLDAYNVQRQVTDAEYTFLPKAISYSGGVAMLWFIQHGFPEFALQYDKRAQGFTASRNSHL